MSRGFGGRGRSPELRNRLLELGDDGFETPVHPGLAVDEFAEHFGRKADGHA